MLQLACLCVLHMCVLCMLVCTSSEYVFMLQLACLPVLHLCIYVCFSLYACVYLCLWFRLHPYMYFIFVYVNTCFSLLQLCLCMHTSPCMHVCTSVVFGLVGFFVLWHINPYRLFNAKANLLEEQLWYYLTHSWEDKEVPTFPKGICLKVNVIARLEFKLAYYYSTVHHFNHYTTRAPLSVVYVHT